MKTSYQHILYPIIINRHPAICDIQSFTTNSRRSHYKLTCPGPAGALRAPWFVRGGASSAPITGRAESAEHARQLFDVAVKVIGARTEPVKRKSSTLVWRGSATGSGRTQIPVQADRQGSPYDSCTCVPTLVESVTHFCPEMNGHSKYFWACNMRPVNRNIARQVSIANKISMPLSIC